MLSFSKVLCFLRLKSGKAVVTKSELSHAKSSRSALRQSRLPKLSMTLCTSQNFNLSLRSSTSLHQTTPPIHSLSEHRNVETTTYQRQPHQCPRRQEVSHRHRQHGGQSQDTEHVAARLAEGPEGYGPVGSHYLPRGHNLKHHESRVFDRFRRGA